RWFLLHPLRRVAESVWADSCPSAHPWFGTSWQQPNDPQPLRAVGLWCSSPNRHPKGNDAGRNPQYIGSHTRTGPPHRGFHGPCKCRLTSPRRTAANPKLQRVRVRALGKQVLLFFGTNSLENLVDVRFKVIASDTPAIGALGFLEFVPLFLADDLTNDENHHG